MFDFEIGKVADTLMEMSALVGKDLETTWKYYIHDLIKMQFSFDDIKAYIEKKQKQGEEADKASKSGHKEI